MQLNVPIRILSKFKGLFGGKNDPPPTMEIKPVSPLKNLIECPEDYRLEAYFEGEGLIIKVKPKKSAPKYRIDHERVQALRARINEPRKIQGM